MNNTGYKVVVTSIDTFCWRWEIFSQLNQLVASGTEDTEERAQARAYAVLQALTGPIPVQ